MLLLASKGVPWSEIVTWSADRRLAASVALGELDGSSFDWDRGEWVRPG